MKEAIKVENLAYTYSGVEDTPDVVVFEDLDLTIEEGSFFDGQIQVLKNHYIRSIFYPGVCVGQVFCLNCFLQKKHLFSLHGIIPLKCVSDPRRPPYIL